VNAARASRGPTPEGAVQYRAVASRGAGRRPSSRSGRRLAGLLRFVVFLLLIFVAVWAGVRVAHAGTVGSVYTGHEYIVSAGDTLWGIAAQEYGTDVDLRRAVYEIRAVNHLAESAVSPGERLTLPYLER